MLFAKHLIQLKTKLTLLQYQEDVASKNTEWR